MKRMSIISLVLFFVATAAFAHAGEVHTYLGTVTKISHDGSFVMTMTNGKDRTVLVSKATTYSHGDGRKGQRSEVIVGKRVAVKMSKDGKTALNVKLSAPKKSRKS